MNQALWIIFVFMSGMGFGLLIKSISDILITRRMKQLTIDDVATHKQEIVFFALATGIIWALIAGQDGLNIQSIANMLLISVALMIALVDLKIQKIPNELLLLVLVIGTTLIISGWPGGHLVINIAGFIIGFVIFVLPAFLGRGAGWGDVKYAAVVGFCLGIHGLIFAILMMSIAVLLYATVFLVRKKEDLKKKIALGPFITLGFTIVLVFNLAA
ncbi:A24 family peptidase [Eubacteriaceae bacterium ES3]|nr:A24 family peptidase [Eubacteriaceae bacterium ES3]